MKDDNTLAPYRALSDRREKGYRWDSGLLVKKTTDCNISWKGH